jgi:glycosyltransferase involved in cell wall biosynthesis
MMDRPLHVAHAVLSLDVGGLERFVTDLVSQGRQRGQRVSVICLERPGALAPQAEALGARVVSLGKRPGLRPGLVGRFRGVLRRLGPDVLHTHQISALFYAGPAARRAGVPAVVHTEHGKHFGRRRTRWLGWLAARFADRFVCVSEDIAAEVRRHGVAPRAAVCVVPNGIDTARFARPPRGSAAVRSAWGIPADAPVVGTVGRLHEVKQQDLLLRAFAGARQRGTGAYLMLVGDGPLRPELEGLAAALGVSEWVRFTGFQPRPEEFLGALDVFALTSRSEGMPLAVLEAWAAGVPVIASRVGGVPELIEDGVNGLLFPPGDEAALVAGLCRLLGDRGYASRLGLAGAGTARDGFDLRHAAGRYEDHYRAALAVARPAAASPRGAGPRALCTEQQPRCQGP